SDIEGDARHLGAVTDASQPLERGAQGPVAGKEAWDEDDRPPESRGDVDAAKNRIAYEAEIFEIDSALEPHRGDGVPRAQVAEVGEHRGCDLLPASASFAVMLWGRGQVKF